MIFRLYTVYNKHEMIKNWQSSQRKIASIITNARIIMYTTVVHEALSLIACIVNERLKSLNLVWKQVQNVFHHFMRLVLSKHTLSCIFSDRRLRLYLDFHRWLMHSVILCFLHDRRSTFSPFKFYFKLFLALKIKELKYFIAIFNCS